MKDQVQHYQKLLEKKINQGVKKAQINCQMIIIYKYLGIILIPIN